MQNDIDELNRRNVRLRVIGSRAQFAPDIQEQMTYCEELTQGNTELNLSVAVNYGGRWDIVEATKKVAEQVLAGDLALADIDDARVAENLSLAGLPEPDLLIRTGGEHRVSNFLLWDLAYTELYFTETFWPDFDVACLESAVTEFCARTRRFGRRE